jgi:hypothetical protein
MLGPLHEPLIKAVNALLQHAVNEFWSFEREL